MQTGENPRLRPWAQDTVNRNYLSFRIEFYMLPQQDEELPGGPRLKFPQS